jgi:hypothetical protein
MTQLIHLTEWHINIHKSEINLRAKGQFDLENENASLITGEAAVSIYESAATCLSIAHQSRAGVYTYIYIYMYCLRAWSTFVVFLKHVPQLCT